MSDEPAPPPEREPAAAEHPAEPANGSVDTGPGDLRRSARPADDALAPAASMGVPAAPEPEPDDDKPYLIDDPRVPPVLRPPPLDPALHPLRPHGFLRHEDAGPPLPPELPAPVDEGAPVEEHPIPLLPPLVPPPLPPPTGTEAVLIPPAPDESALPDLPREPSDWQLLSLVVPVFNERESLRPLHAEITAAVRGLSLETEIVFVDDGSTDGSWDVIRSLAAADPRVRGLRLRANFGKAAALAAGFRMAGGEVVMTLDADLQDDPKEIPKFLAALRAGFDVVSGWKKVRHDPWHKTAPSKVFNWLVGRVTGVRLHDHNCGFKAYRAQVLREVHLYGELHRFVPVLAAGRGFRVGELVINHRPRKFGHSKYGWRRFVKGLLDLFTVRLLTGFGRRPQHLLGTTGLVSWSLALGLLFVLGVNALVRWSDATAGIGMSGQILLGILSLGGFLFGTQMFLAGLTAEFFVARSVVNADPYGVADHAGVVRDPAPVPPVPRSDAMDLE